MRAVKKKKPAPIKTEDQIKQAAEKFQSLSIEELKKRLRPRSPNKKENPDIEQKIIMLKILQLNSMKYTETAKIVHVNKNTLMKWSKALGHLIYTVKPEEIVAQQIETDLATLKANTTKEAYRLLNNNIRRMNNICETLTGTRGIYAMAEAIRSTTEVLRLEKELNDFGKPQGTDFFMNIHNMMVKNIYGDNGKQD